MRRSCPIRPTHWIDRALWTVTSIALVALAVAWWFPYSADDHGAWYDRVAWIAFVTRALAAHVGLALVVLLLMAVVRRSWILTALLAVVCATLLSPLAHRTPGPRSTRDGDLRVMSANVLYSSSAFARTLRRIDDERPDVVVLQEYTLAWDRAIGDELDARFPHAVRTSERGLRGLAVFSRYPVVRDGDVAEVREPGVRPGMRVVLDIEGRDLAIYNVHPVTSMSVRKARIQRRQIAALVRELERERLPRIVAGDLNLTETSRPYDLLLDTGIRAGWDEVGRGQGATWKHHSAGLIPGLRLDHIFASDGLEFRRMEIAPDIGSDHRPLVADLRVRR